MITRTASLAAVKNVCWASADAALSVDDDSIEGAYRISNTAPFRSAVLTRLRLSPPLNPNPPGPPPLAEAPAVERVMMLTWFGLGLVNSVHAFANAS